MDDNKKDLEMNTDEKAGIAETTAAPLSLDTEDDEVAAIVTEEEPATEIPAPAESVTPTAEISATSGLSLDPADDTPTPTPTPVPTEAPAPLTVETAEIPSIDTMETATEASVVPQEENQDVSVAQAALQGMEDTETTSEHDIPVIDPNKTVSEAAAEKAQKEQEEIMEQDEFEEAMQDDLPEETGGKKKAMMLGLVGLLVVGGAGAFWFMNQNSDAGMTPQKWASSVDTTETQAPPTVGVFDDMPPMPSASEPLAMMAIEEAPAAKTDMGIDTSLAEMEAIEDISLETAEVPELEIVENVAAEVPDLPMEAVDTPEPELAPTMEITATDVEEKESMIEEPTAAELALVAEAGAPVSTPQKNKNEDLKKPVVAKQDMAAAMAPKAPTERVVKESFTDKEAKEYINNLGQAAQIRPLPKSYLVLRKTAERDSLNTNIVAAQRALNEGRLRAAADMFETLYMKHGDNVRVAMGRALAYHKLKNNRKALPAYEDVLKLEPKNLEALTNMLGILRLQEPELALERLLDLYELYPTNETVLAQLGGTYGHMKQYSKAIKYLDMAVALAPESSLFHYNRAVVLDHMARRHEAAASYRRSLALFTQTGKPMSAANIPVAAIRARLNSLQ